MDCFGGGGVWAKESLIFINGSLPFAIIQLVVLLSLGDSNFLGTQMLKKTIKYIC